MANDAQRNGRGSGIPWRVIGWGGAGFLLLLPLVANASWTASDFIFMGVLLGSVGLGLEILVRKSSSVRYRIGAALALLTAFLTVWVNAAVGMIGSEDNVLNLLFGAVLAIALIGGIVARFQPAGMARAMLSAAVAQAAISAAGLSMDVRGGVLSMGFAGLWLLAAAMFRAAAREQIAGAARQA